MRFARSEREKCTNFEHHERRNAAEIRPRRNSVSGTRLAQGFSPERRERP